MNEIFDDEIPIHTTLFSDNQGALAILKNDRGPARTKHIDTKFKFVKWTIKLKKYDLVYVPTNQNLADSFTKPLSGDKFKEHMNETMIRLTKSGNFQ